MNTKVSSKEELNQTFSLMQCINIKNFIIFSVWVYRHKEKHFSQKSIFENKIIHIFSKLYKPLWERILKSQEKGFYIQRIPYYFYNQFNESHCLDLENFKCSINFKFSPYGIIDMKKIISHNNPFLKIK